MSRVMGNKALAGTNTDSLVETLAPLMDIVT